MTAARTAVVLALGLLVPPAGAVSPAQEMAALSAQRELLIARILRGSEHEQAILDFVALLKRRSELRAAHSEINSRAPAPPKESADYEAGWRCTLSADPAQPVASDEGRFRADWGKVVRVQQLRKAPNNELDDGEGVTLFEVEGRAGRHLVRGERMGRGLHSDFSAAVGELVMVCEGSRSSEPALPPPWNAVQIVRSGLAFRIARPPKIVEKAGWNPRHITRTRYFWAVHDVRWRYPPGQFVLSYLQIHRDLGGGQFEIQTDNGKNFVIVMPAALPRRGVIAPGKWLWLILGEPRFDRTLRTLVLTVADVEEHYIEER